MTVLWRISRHRDLGGAGGLRAAGRWHHAGRRILYLAETPAAALLEVCVHTAANDVPAAFTLLRLEGPGMQAPSVRPDRLPPDWRERLAVTRAIGAAWRAGGKSLLLRVPSAVVPATMNCLFNPAHPDAAKFRVVAAMDWPFDRRLKG